MKKEGYRRNKEVGGEEKNKEWGEKREDECDDTGGMRGEGGGCTKMYG